MTEFIIICQSELQKDGSYRIERYRELVRCKDCKNGDSIKNAKGEPMIDCVLSFDGWLKEPDWFCADGRRRDNASE